MRIVESLSGVLYPFYCGALEALLLGMEISLLTAIDLINLCKI